MKSRLIFGLSILTTAIIILVAWHKDPLYNSVPTPGMTVFYAIFGFVMASLLIFGANGILALLKARKAKSDEELNELLSEAGESVCCLWT